MNERRGLHGAVRVLMGRVASSHPVELLIDKGHQFIESRLIAIAPISEQLGDVRRCAQHQKTLCFKSAIAEYGKL